MFTLNEWMKTNVAKTRKAKRTIDVVLMPSFWNNVVYHYLKVMRSLVHVLRLVNHEKKSIWVTFMKQCIDSRSSHLRSNTGRPRPIREQPNEERPSCVFHVSHPTQRPPQHQHRCHVTPGVTKQRASQGLETEKPKFARGDRLGFQRTLVELILSVQAIGGEPPPSTMTIVMEDGSI
ncbi:hypothetical protein CR513_55774, partial [Mucuna pruriens]